MNSAAVIGRQLRQNPPRSLAAPPTPAKLRPRTPSHTPHPPHPPPASPPPSPPAAPPAWLAAVSCRCIWRTCKALSLGLFLCAVGTAMSVVGFYAEPLSTEVINATLSRVDEVQQAHLYNLTYVGPVLLGLGGFALVAACVMALDYTEQQQQHRVVPDGPGTAETAFLDVPPPTVVPFVVAKPRDKGGGVRLPTLIDEIIIEVQTSVVPNGPAPLPPKRPDVLLSKSGSKDCSRPPPQMSPTLEELIPPSPQDVILPDPDGCGDTPCQERAPMPVSRAVRYLASIETLSDISTPASLELDARLPLLGGVRRCSPPSPPLLKRDNRRNTLLRQSAIEVMPS